MKTIRKFERTTTRYAKQDTEDRNTLRPIRIETRGQALVRAAVMRSFENAPLRERMVKRGRKLD